MHWKSRRRVVETRQVLPHQRFSVAHYSIRLGTLAASYCLLYHPKNRKRREALLCWMQGKAPALFREGRKPKRESARVKEIKKSEINQSIASRPGDALGRASGDQGADRRIRGRTSDYRAKTSLGRSVCEMPSSVPDARVLNLVPQSGPNISAPPLSLRSRRSVLLSSQH
jgi:hypothetical protein